jgi:hypothetical protein
MALPGRAAMNIQRLNIIENNLANRIIERLEEFPEFTGSDVVAIVGVPYIQNSIQQAEFIGNFGTPSLVSFSKLYLLNEISGYSFKLPDSNQLEIAYEKMGEMDTWPGANSVVYYDGIFIVYLYY